MSLNSLFIILFVAIMATSTANGQGFLGVVVNVNGTLYCSPNGSSGINPTPVFPNTLIEVVCTGGVLVPNPSNATTKADGGYVITLIRSNNATLASVISNCRVSVPAPLSTCNPALPSSGLVSGLQFVKTIPNSFLPITYMVPSGFTLQT